MQRYVYKYTSKQWLIGDYSVSGLPFQKSRVWGISPNSFKLQTQDFWNSKPPTLSTNWPLVMYIYIYIYSVSYVLINAGWKHTPTTKKPTKAPMKRPPTIYSTISPNWWKQRFDIHLSSNPSTVHIVGTEQEDHCNDQYLAQKMAPKNLKIRNCQTKKTKASTFRVIKIYLYMSHCWNFCCAQLHQHRLQAPGFHGFTCADHFSVQAGF